MLATQVGLDRAGFSPGEIDAQGGAKTRLALAALQSSSSSPLDIPSEPLIDYTITEHDVAGPFIDAVPRDLMGGGPDDMTHDHHGNGHSHRSDLSTRHGGAEGNHGHV